MCKEIAEVIRYLHHGERNKADTLLDDLKKRAVYLDEDIQHDVLIFAEQVHFQFDYDPWHKVTPNVQIAADQLIEDLGYFSWKKRAS